MTIAAATLIVGKGGSRSSRTSTPTEADSARSVPGELRAAKMAFKTYGTLNAAKDNVIVYPCWYSGTHVENEWLIGEGMALDPGRYFIIVPNMFGNGLSTSPSNTPVLYNGSRFPHVTAYDNVVQQHRLVTEKFGISAVKLVTGWSMGALQTFH